MLGFPFLPESLVVYLDIGSGLANSQNNKPCFLLSSSNVGSSVALPCLPLSSKLSVGKTASLTWKGARPDLRSSWKRLTRELEERTLTSPHLNGSVLLVTDNNDGDGYVGGGRVGILLTECWPLVAKIPFQLQPVQCCTPVCFLKASTEEESFSHWLHLYH